MIIKVQAQVVPGMILTKPLNAFKTVTDIVVVSALGAEKCLVIDSEGVEHCFRKSLLGDYECSGYITQSSGQESYKAYHNVQGTVSHFQKVYNAYQQAVLSNP